MREIKLLIENKLIICALGNLHYEISRGKIEPEPGFQPRTSRFLAVSRGRCELELT